MKIVRKVMIEFADELAPRFDVGSIESAIRGLVPDIKRVVAIREDPPYAHWRRSHGYHYFVNGKYGLGHVCRSYTGLWGAHYLSKSKFDIAKLKDAKAWVEEQHDKRTRRNRRRK